MKYACVNISVSHWPTPKLIINDWKNVTLKINLIKAHVGYVWFTSEWHHLLIISVLCWRSLTIWIYWECHLIISWPLRSIFARFPEQLLKNLVSWGSPGGYSMINCSSGDAFEVLSCQFFNTVLQCGVRLPIHTLNYWTA